MKHLYLLIILLLCVKLNSLEWTLIYYFASDNGLYDNALNDINQLEAGIQDNMNVIVFIDHPETSLIKGAEVLKLVRDNSDEIVSPRIKYYGALDSGDYHTLADFSKWALKRYPAEKTALNIWSHGTGWYKSEDYETKYVCPDNATNSFISVAEGDLRNALNIINHRFDMIVFDACLMGNVETMCEIKDYADYMIASATLVPINGFPWDDVLNEWNNYPDLDELSSKIVDLYCESYWPGGSQNPYGDTQYIASAFSAKMLEFEPLLNALRNFSDKYALSSALDVFRKTRNQCYGFNDLLADIEILQYFTLLQANADPSSELFTDSSLILHLINNLFISKNSLELPVEGTASFWYPNEVTMFDTIYRDSYHKLIFSAYHFPRFINYSFGEDTRIPYPIINFRFHDVLSSLYLYWDAPIDPCSLNYQIKIFENDQLIHTASTSLPEYIYNYQQNQTNLQFQISVLDEALNESEPYIYDFVPENNHKIPAFVCPNPVNNINNAKLKFFLDDAENNLSIKVYTIAGDMIGEKQLSNLNSGEYSLDLNHLLINNNKISTGLYTIVLKGNHLSYRFKFTILL